MKKYYHFTKNNIDVLSKKLNEKFKVLDENTMSVKEYFFPQYEKLFAFKGKKGCVEITPIDTEVKETVYWKIKPCDLEAVKLLDKIFLPKDLQDDKYKLKRDNTFLIGVICNEPNDTCFCSSIGYDQIKDTIADILFIEISKDEYAAVVSKKGKELIDSLNIQIEEETKENLDKLAKTIEEFNFKFKINFKLSKNLKNLKDFFDDPYFEDAAFKCLECGLCSHVCPTCHCFTVSDKVVNNEGYRMKCRDRCLSEDFTTMAGGHNPRTKKCARLRQRFMHKAFYLPEKHDILGCVGCGRCLEKCPVSMDICDALMHIRKGDEETK